MMFLTCDNASGGPVNPVRILWTPVKMQTERPDSTGLRQAKGAGGLPLVYPKANRLKTEEKSLLA